MGIFKEQSLSRMYGEELEVPVQYNKISRSVKKPIEGQISFGILNIAAEMPKTRVEPKKNEVKQTSNVDLPVDKEYLDNTKVAFLDPKIITFIKNNVIKIGKNGILGDAIKFCDKTDEDIIKRLVVFPTNTSLYDYHGSKEIVFPGGVITLPVSMSGNYGPEQKFIYVGNFSKDEERCQKSNTRYKLTNIKGDLVWRSMSVGEDLPANYGKGVRVEMSVNGINEIKTYK